MVQPDPEPEPKPGPDTEPVPAAEAEPVATAETDPVPDSKAEAEPEEDAETKQRRMVNRFLWSCSWLTVLTGVFLLSGMVQSFRSYDALAWLGAVVAVLCLLALIAAYFACTRDKLTLRTRVVGRFDLFQASTVVVVIAVVCGLLVPSSNSSALALLLPWALTYWMYGLDRTKAPAS